MYWWTGLEEIEFWSMHVSVHRQGRVPPAAGVLIEYLHRVLQTLRTTTQDPAERRRWAASQSWSCWISSPTWDNEIQASSSKDLTHYEVKVKLINRESHQHVTLKLFLCSRPKPESSLVSWKIMQILQNTYFWRVRGDRTGYFQTKNYILLLLSQQNNLNWS